MSNLVYIYENSMYMLICIYIIYIGNKWEVFELNYFYECKHYSELKINIHGTLQFSEKNIIFKINSK